MKTFIIYNSPVAATKKFAESVKETCKQYGFDAELFDGIWKTEAESFLQERGIKLNEQWVKDSEWYKKRGQVKNLLKAFKTLGQQGCFASHYLLWEKCIELNTPICIFEYDIQLKRQLPEGILNQFTDAIEICVTPKVKDKRTTNNYSFTDFKYINYPYPYFARGGSTGYIIKPEGAKKLVKTATEKGYLGTDVFLNRDWIDYKKLSPSIADNFLDFSVNNFKYKNA
jgi:GR25 family glycosyltransferase involved in LPS biosynthesis